MEISTDWCRLLIPNFFSYGLYLSGAVVLSKGLKTPLLANKDCSRCVLGLKTGAHFFYKD